VPLHDTSPYCDPLISKDCYSQASSYFHAHHYFQESDCSFCHWSSQIGPYSWASRLTQTLNRVHTQYTQRVQAQYLLQKKKLLINLQRWQRLPHHSLHIQERFLVRFSKLKGGSIFDRDTTWLYLHYCRFDSHQAHQREGRQQLARCRCLCPCRRREDRWSVILGCT